MNKLTLSARKLARPLIAFMVMLLYLCCSSPLFAQMRISDRPVSSTAPSTTINANSLLELESSSRGLLLPRLTTNQISAMQGVPEGMMVYNSTNNLLAISTRSGWLTLVGNYSLDSPVAPWKNVNNVAFNISSKVGINTAIPISQFANTSINTTGSDNIGSSTDSFSWSINRIGYAGQINNTGIMNNANGLVVKINSLNATALDVSQGTQNGTATPLLTVKGSGRIGIGISTPSEALDVNGNIKYSGVLQMGVQYLFADGIVNANSNTTLGATCPVGSKLIGGGGGQRDISTTQSYFSLSYSGPDNDDSNTWRIITNNQDSSPVAIRAYVICAKVQ